MNHLTDHLRVAALPLDIKWADIDANLAAVELAFSALPEKTDVVVLPELFSTGYANEPESMAALAERNTGRTIDFIKDLAAKHGVAIVGSFLASTPPSLYNRGFIIEPNGDETFYDKRHLFSLSSEAKVFKHGIDPVPVVRFRGWNIAMVICYDLRFPVWCRTRNNNYDLLVVVANWPQARAYAFEHLLIARAIENQCAVVGADRGGSDIFGLYDGLTQIYDHGGRPVGSVAGPFVVADLSRMKQDEYRRKFPVSLDADSFSFI